MEAEADGTTVMDALYANKSSLEAIFNIIDADNSGSINITSIKTHLNPDIILFRRNNSR